MATLQHQQNPQQYQFQQQQQIPQSIQVQAPSVNYTGTTCCGPFRKVLVGRSRSTAYGIGIAILITGLVSLITGIVGFFVNGSWVYFYGRYRYIINPTPYIGANIWAGIFYILTGIFGIASSKNQTNPHLLNSYFAFAIISLILAIPHFGVSLGILVQFIHVLGRTIWFNSVALILSIIAFSLSLSSLVILGNNVYCNQCKSTTVSAVHYQGANQVVTIQQYPAQHPAPYAVHYSAQPVMTFQPTVPVYVPNSTTGQYAAAANRTAINNPEKSQLPSYSNLPDLQSSANQP
ncbi:hypothetical protein TrispH2_008321 [Trichoplax sp. H2]|nr:hypothetical protein TrispH2_008321 [Trichoplax sp. H2]|eukprot:RDD39335.1 hypothetical protein TrispH2_008321 [Trichoplax sp. H2]